MAHVVTEACIGSKDRSCIEVCPVDCIYEADRLMVIHPDECIDCGACVPECPVEAIYVENALPDASRPFVAVNEAITSGREAVDAAVPRALEAASAATPGRARPLDVA